MRISSISSDMDKWVRGFGENKRALHAKSSFLLTVNRMRNNRLKNAAGSNPMALTPKRDQPAVIAAAAAALASDSTSNTGTPEFFQLNDAELDKWLQEIQDQDEEENGEVKEEAPAQKAGSAAATVSPKLAGGKPPLPHPTMTIALPESTDSLDESVCTSTISRGSNSNKYEYFLDAAKHSFG
jgi:hypothetical protein